MARAAIVIAMHVAFTGWALAGEAPQGSQPKKPAAPEPDIIFGKVYAVDAKLRLVMIDVGSADGVEPLQRFIIHRDEVFVGYVTISTVLPTASAGLIDKLHTIRSVKVGDFAAAHVEPGKQ